MLLPWLGLLAAPFNCEDQNADRCSEEVIQVGEEGASCGTVAQSQRWDEQAGKWKNNYFF